MALAAGLLALGLAWAGIAAFSSARVLADVSVDSQAQEQALAPLRDRIGRDTVLYLGRDDFGSWHLRDGEVFAIGETATARVPYRKTKPLPGALTPPDFDSPDPGALARSRWVITVRSGFQSQAPKGFRRVAQTSLYALWKRTGRPPARSTLPGESAPGKQLSCRPRTARRLVAAGGTAATMTPPRAASLVPGPPRTMTATLRLPRGRWELSADYASRTDLRFSAPGLDRVMPAMLARGGPAWTLGTVRSRGRRLVVTVTQPAPSLIQQLLGVVDQPGAGFNHALRPARIVAVSAPAAAGRRQLMPIARACGRYVDWTAPGR
jgi:hypothetical protein